MGETRTEPVKCVRGSTERRKKSTISNRGGRLVAAHSGHRTSEKPEPVGTRDAYRPPTTGALLEAPPGPVLQVDNEGLPRQVGQRREHGVTEGDKRSTRMGAREGETEGWEKKQRAPPFSLSKVTPPKNARRHS